MSDRINHNGAVCDRCDTNRTMYQVNWPQQSSFVCPDCMTPEERACFESLNPKECQE